MFFKHEKKHKCQNISETKMNISRQHNVQKDYIYLCTNKQVTTDYCNTALFSCIKAKYSKISSEYSSLVTFFKRRIDLFTQSLFYVFICSSHISVPCDQTLSWTLLRCTPCWGWRLDVC